MKRRAKKNEEMRRKTAAEDDIVFEPLIKIDTSAIQIPITNNDSPMLSKPALEE